MTVEARTKCGKIKVPYQKRGHLLTQYEVADRLGISQGRVLQIEQQALMKLFIGLSRDEEMRAANDERLSRRGSRVAGNRPSQKALALGLISEADDQNA